MTRKTVAAALALLGVAWAGVAAIDGAARRVQRETEEKASVASTHGGDAEPPGRSRVFMFLVDSFRAETAESLPALQALRARGAFVRVRASQDAATVPSLRAAFTGQTQRSVFSFARNFVRAGGAWDSVFTDLASRGLTSVAYSDGSFFELAAGITAVSNDEEGEAGEEARQRRELADALARFKTGKDQLVVFHLTLADHAAHKGGIHGPTYAAAFATVDAMVREADAAVPADATLVVFGDHGHDVEGRHFPGLEVPTVAVYRGPGFQAGAAAGPLPLTVHRYLLSWALGLPLPASYHGAAATELLRAGLRVPAAFAAPPPEVSSVSRRAARLGWMLPFYAALAAAIAFGVRRLAWPPRLAGRPATVPIAAAAVVVAAFAAWGYFLVQRRLVTPPQGPGELFGIWLAGVAAAALVVGAGLVRSSAAAWLALAGPALLLYPTAARDSWAAGMGRIWSVALVAALVAWARRRFVVERAGGTPLPAPQKLALAALPFLGFCVMPFFYVEADGFVFGNWRGYLTLDWMGFWIVLATGVRCVLFLRPGRGVLPNVVGLAIVALLSLVSFGDVLPSQPARLAAAGVLAALALAARAASADRARAVASPLANAALLMAFRGSVVLDERTLLQLELALAALRVSQLVVDALAAPAERRAWGLWLEALALVVSAWSTLALTLHRLEWRFLYSFVPPALVERWIGLFLPLIVGRYAIPLVLARRLLSEARWPDARRTWPATVGIAGAKVVTLVLVATGYGIFDPTSELFTEAVQNVLTFSAPLLALAYNPHLPRPEESRVA